MELAEILRAAGRRWYILVLGLLVTAGLAFLVIRLIPLSYDADSSVLLLPPTNSVAQTVGNPFLNLGGLDVVAGVLSESVTDSDSVNSIIPAGSHAKYTVEPDPRLSGSVLAVTATDITSAGAFRTMNEVLDLAKVRLKTLQDSVNAPADAQVRLMVITNNTVAAPDYASLLRTLIVVIVTGLVFTILLAISIDALVRRRRAEQAPKQSEGSSSPHADTPPEPDTLPESDPFESRTDEYSELLRDH